jgi:hypothetical protein
MMKKTIKNLNIAYNAVFIIAFAVVFIGKFVIKNQFSIDPLSDTGITLQSVLTIFIVGAVPASLYLFNRATKKWAAIENIEEKLKKYQTGSYIRLTVMGTGLVLGIVFFYVMLNRSLLFCAAIAVIGLFFCKPSEAKIVSELKLEDETNNEVNEENQIDNL